ncbi:ABC transporter permease [Candidatus Woesearchaeota archaeon]|nr:ABC transporter permease [Candidatus Woesearchaeota archaeon]
MRLRKIVQLAWNILAHSKLRSWLTIIGIIIGIAAVVSIVSVSQGAKQNLESRFSDLGADLLTISPGFSRASGFRGPGGNFGVASGTDQDPLTEKDILAIRTIPNVKIVMGQVSGSAKMKYLGETGDVTVTGVDTVVWKDMTTDELGSGRYLTQGDAYSVVLGHRRATTFFDKEVQLNRQIALEGKIFKVVGILKEGYNDNAVIIPLNPARDMLDDIEDDEVSSITVKVADVDKVNETEAAIEKKLMLSRGILKADDKDFSILSSANLRSTISETLNTMSIFLGAIAAISLVVGAVGISNTMFTSVLEKTKEIGVMKAIGAKNRDILMIFLINSGMIGFVGGLGGVILGSVASGYISLLVSGVSNGGGPGGGFTRMFSSTALSPELLIFAFAFSIVIGVIAGVIPAYRASKLRPVDALRYE